MVQEKNRVAFISVLAAIFLTGFKLIVGLVTGSLGILSEALHSGLDLVAAVITLFAVKVSDRPADKNHHYGHGKVENLSALIETLLLFITCFWIIYEAMHRLILGKTEIEVTAWSYIVVVSSIIIDFSRSRALSRVAKKYNSQALEADALHFSTDIWSSSVVLLGLICANFGFFFADSVAALVVAMIVIYVCYKLGKRSIDMLLDRVSPEIQEKIENSINHVTEITHYHDLKIRSSGADTFVEVCIHVKPGLSIDEAHQISHHVDDEIKKNVTRAHVHIHTEPETETEIADPIINK
ncbi:MAG: cation transporter [Porphyromonadaceae bacterium]|nr:MAG: cation transporter [Porphyromonadaceae bacterium]